MQEAPRHREHDHLVEPLYAALDEPARAEPEEEGAGRAAVRSIVLVLALAAVGGGIWLTLLAG